MIVREPIFVFSFLITKKCEYAQYCILNFAKITKERDIFKTCQIEYKYVHIQYYIVHTYIKYICEYVNTLRHENSVGEQVPAEFMCSEIYYNLNDCIWFYVRTAKFITSYLTLKSSTASLSEFTVCTCRLTGLMKPLSNAKATQ